jgi:hypothetical protein
VITRRAFLLGTGAAVSVMAPERILRARSVSLPASPEVLASPFQFLVTGIDHLRVRAWCSTAGVVLAIDQRFGLLEGPVQASGDTLICGSDRNARTKDITLAAGYVLNLVVRAESGSPRVGQCYVTIDVIRGTGPAAIVLGQMVGGYVTASQGLAWPGTPIRTSLEGPGYETTIATYSAMGVGFIETAVPTNARWRPSSVYAQYNAFLGGPNRRFQVYLFDPSHNVLSLVEQPGSLAGGSNGVMTWARGYPVAGDLAAGYGIAPLPVDLLMVGGETIFYLCPTWIAGDVIQALLITATEWLEAA